MSLDGCLGVLFRVLIIWPFLAFLDLAWAARFHPHPLQASFADDLVEANVLGPDDELSPEDAVRVAQAALGKVSGHRRLSERRARALIGLSIREAPGLADAYVSPLGLSSHSSGEDEANQ